MVKRIFYGWWIVLASFFIGLYVAGSVFYGFTAFFEPIIAEYGWSYTQVSIASSLRGLEMGILAPIMGFFVDRFGPRKLVFFGIITSGFGLILLSLTESLVTLYAAFLLLALGGGSCTSVVLMTAVANWFKKNLGKTLGIVACGFGAGGLLVPLVVWLIDIFDWRTALIILGSGMWALGIPLAFIIRDKPEQYGYHPDGEALAGQALSTKARWHEDKGNFKDILRDRTLWLISIAESVRWIIVTTVIIHIMPYLSSIGIPRTNAAYVATAIPLFSLIGRFGFGWLGDIYDKRHILAGTYCLMGAGMLAFAYIHVGWMIFPFLLFFPPAYGGGVTLRGAILSEHFGTASLGRTLGIVMGISAIGGILGPALGGWTFDKLGDYHLIWLVFSGLTSISVAAILLAKPKKLAGSEAKPR